MLSFCGWFGVDYFGGGCSPGWCFGFWVCVACLLLRLWLTVRDWCLFDYWLWVLLGGFVDYLARLLLLLGLNLYVVCFLLVLMVVYYGLSSMFGCVCGFAG